MIVMCSLHPLCDLHSDTDSFVNLQLALFLDELLERNSLN